MSRHLIHVGRRRHQRGGRRAGPRHSATANSTTLALPLLGAAAAFSGRPLLLRGRSLTLRRCPLLVLTLATLLLAPTRTLINDLLS